MWVTYLTAACASAEPQGATISTTVHVRSATPTSSISKRMKSRQPDAKSQIICLADYLQKHKGQATVPDPYYGSQRDFEFALDLIEDACEGLLHELVTSL